MVHPLWPQVENVAQNTKPLNNNIVYILTGCKLSLEKQYRIDNVTFRFFANFVYFCQYLPIFANAELAILKS